MNRKRVSGATAAVIACLLAFVAAPGATASPLDEFNPRAYFAVSTPKAGAHPDVTIGLTKGPTGCYDSDGELESSCRYDPNKTPPYAGEILPGQTSGFYMEQDPKEFSAVMPEGLVADIGAPHSYCDARTIWVPFDFEVSVKGKPEVLEMEGPYSGCRSDEALRASQIGTVDITASGCFPLIFPEYRLAFCPESTFLSDTGPILWERPKTRQQGAPFDEAAAMTAFWPYRTDAEAYAVTSRISFRLNPTNFTVEALATGLPNYLENRVRPRECGEEVPETDPHCQLQVRPGSGLQLPIFPAQASELYATINGVVGPQNAPFITNSTSCAPRNVYFEFVGWAVNTFEGIVPESRPAADGWRALRTASYQATDCDALPYSPTFTLAMDSRPSHEGEISATVTQQPTEATTESVEIVFPPSVPINLATKTTTCSEQQIKSQSCPESARVGTASATALGDVAVSGPIYLTRIGGTTLGIVASLSGKVGQQDVSFDIKGEGSINSKGEVAVKFSGLPNFPVKAFGLRMEGGSKALFKTPTRCGGRDVRAFFRAHNGKTFERTSRIVTLGCANPVFDAELSSTKPGDKTRLTLTVGSTGTTLRDAIFTLPPDLLLATQPDKPINASAKQDGTIKLTTATGELQAPFELTGQGSNVTIASLTGQASPGLSGIGGFLSLNGATLTPRTKGIEKVGKTEKRKRAENKKKAYKDKRRKKAGKGPRKGKGKRKGEKRSKQIQRIRIDSLASGQLTLTGFPEGKETTALELTLGNPARQLFLITAKKCGATLPFTANVRTEDGRVLLLQDSVRLDDCMERVQSSLKKKRPKRKRNARSGR